MKQKSVSWLTIAVLVVACTATTVYATDYNSTNFISRDPVFGDYGAYKSSGSFQQLDVGGQVAIGESESTSFILRSGFLYFNDFTARTENWRWYNDETNETPTSALAAENTAPTGVANENIIKLRWTVRELAGISSASFKMKLQYSLQADFSSGVVDIAEIGDCAASSSWCYADGAGADNALITTSVLSTSDSCVSSVGTGCGTHNESGVSVSPYNHRFSAAMEYEFTIKPAGPLPSTVYYFRVFPTESGSALQPFTGKTYPSLTTESASMTFAVLAVSSGTTTEGITTDVTTTATSIPFGTLTSNVAKEAAQKLQVSTNAPNGYKIYLYQDTPMLSGVGDQIDDVSGTNASPAAWAVPGGQHSAVGYHAGDNLLSAGSTRFAADDTYAALESTAREIVHTGGPVTTEETDTVYKIEVQPLQPAGNYSGGVGYIVVPVF